MNTDVPLDRAAKTVELVAINLLNLIEPFCRAYGVSGSVAYSGNRHELGRKIEVRQAELVRELYPDD